MSDTAQDKNAWLQPALPAIPSWIEYQMRAMQQDGCVVAVARHGEVVLETGSWSPLPASLTR
jgi:hypothetical protein